MAQGTSGGSTSGGGTSRGGTGMGTSRSSRRVNLAPVKKPFPWGFAAGAALLAVLLIGILGYAVSHTGSGFKTAADKLDATFPGIQVVKNPSSNHVSTRVAYPGAATAAPDSGNHNAIPQSCAVYDAALVPEHAVHSLEHGAVWVTYRPDLPADQVAALKTLIDGNSYRLLSPYPGQSSAVGLQAWGRRLGVPSASDPRVVRFLDGYTQGPQTREKGGACSGVDKPGTVPFVATSTGTFVPGDAAQSVPGQGAVPSGASGSAAPGAPAVPGATASVPAAAPGPPTTAPSP